MRTDALVFLLIGAAAMLLAMQAPPLGFGLAWPLVVAALGGAVAGWLEGRSRVRTGRARWGMTLLLPAVGLSLGYALEHLRWRLAHVPNPDSGMALGIAIVLVAAMGAVAALVAAVVATLVARQVRSGPDAR